MEGAGSVGSEDGAISLVTGTSGSPENGKLEVALTVLDRLGTSDLVLLLEDGSSDDGDGVR